MFVFNSSTVCRLLLWTLPFKLSYKQKSQVDRSGDQGGHKTVETVCSFPRALWTYDIEIREVCVVARCSWKNTYSHSSSVSCAMNGCNISVTYTWEFTALLKKMGSTIEHVDILSWTFHLGLWTIYIQNNFQDQTLFVRLKTAFCRTVFTTDIATLYSQRSHSATLTNS